MSATDELKPCPFCGGKAEFRRGSTITPYIRCKECGGRTNGSRNRANLIAAWNRRAVLTSEQAIAATLGVGTCRNVHEPPRNTTFWPTPHFKCSECGSVHVSMDYVYFCPNCGRRVVDE